MRQWPSNVEDVETVWVRGLCAGGFYNKWKRCLLSCICLGSSSAWAASIVLSRGKLLLCSSADGVLLRMERKVQPEQKRMFRQACTLRAGVNLYHGAGCWPMLSKILKSHHSGVLQELSEQLKSLDQVYQEFWMWWIAVKWSQSPKSLQMTGAYRSATSGPNTFLMACHSNPYLGIFCSYDWGG